MGASTSYAIDQVINYTNYTCGIDHQELPPNVNVPHSNLQALPLCFSSVANMNKTKQNSVYVINRIRIRTTKERLGRNPIIRTNLAGV